MQPIDEIRGMRLYSINIFTVKDKNKSRIIFCVLIKYIYIASETSLELKFVV